MKGHESLSDITDEITYTPGRLAKKLGISKSKLMRHLRDTGLIEQCRLTKGGHWKIPYSLAARISSVEALSVPFSRRPSVDQEGRQTMPRNFSQKVSPSSVNEPKPVSIPDYAQIGRSLRRAGVTMKDLLKYIEGEMRVTHEKFQDNTAQRNDENQADGSQTTSGGASSDLSKA